MAWSADQGVWILVILAGAIAGWLLIRYLTRRGLRSALGRIGENEMGAALRERANLVAWLIEATLALVIIGAAASLGILAVLGWDVEPAVTVLALAAAAAAQWLASDGLKIVIVLLFGWIAMGIVRRALPPFIRTVTLRDTEATEREEATKRADTLVTVLVGLGRATIVLLVVFTVLSLLQVPVGPMLAGAGIVGLAVGFGAQHLVRDLIAGTFVLLENQYRQGDVVQIAGIAGFVENVNLRRTLLRDLDGKVHVVPNGEISVASNFTKSWSRVNLDIDVAYRTDLGHAFDVINRIGQELARDDYFGLLLTEPPTVVRVNAFKSSGIELKVLAMCKPLKQWELAGELRRRIKNAFDREGIEIPFPHTTFYWGAQQNPFKAIANGEDGGAAGEDAETIVADDNMTPQERAASIKEALIAAEAARRRQAADTLRQAETRRAQEQDIMERAARAADDDRDGPRQPERGA